MLCALGNVRLIPSLLTLHQPHWPPSSGSWKVTCRAFAFFRVLFPDTSANSPNSFEPLFKPQLEWPSGAPYIKWRAPSPTLQSLSALLHSPPPPPHSTYYFKILCVSHPIYCLSSLFHLQKNVNFIKAASCLLVHHCLYKLYKYSRNIG